METSCSGGNLIVSTGFSARFRALRTGFSPQLTVRSWRVVDLICVRSSSRQITICADAPSTRDILLTNAAKPHGSSSSRAEFLGQPFGLSRLGLHFEFG